MKFWLKDAKITQNFGVSLARSLHTFPLTILLDGEVGTGKTTLLQGFASALGIAEPLTSPTFALEQRYDLPEGTQFAHLDLYRLSRDEAVTLLREQEHDALIRCIEWSDRLPASHWNEPAIRIRMTEQDEGRACDVTFADLPLPTGEQVNMWREDVMLPENVAAHCEAVADLCDRLADAMTDRGIAVRKLALRRAAQLHDLLRFIDFKTNAAPADRPMETPDQIARWEELRRELPHSHEEACSVFLARRGFAALGHIIEPHGLRPGQPERKSIEEDLLFYADKRVIGGTIVTLQERLEDLQKRYGSYLTPGNFEEWGRGANAAEKMLFPDGPPM